MKKAWLGSLLLCLLLCVPQAFAADQQDMTIAVGKAGAKVSVDRVIEEGKLVVSVDDAGQKPILGLGLQDFMVNQFGRQAKVTAVQPFDEPYEVPLNVVLVLDNSYSMVERKAV